MAKWFEVTFFAVGKASKGGDAILVRWESEKESPESILIDGGYAGTYADLIERLPDEIDHVVCSHLDRDHIGGLLELLHDKRKKCSNLWITMTRELLNETAALGRVGANSPEGRVELVLSSVQDGRELLRLAQAREVPTKVIEPGSKIGPFQVLSPNDRLRKSLRIRPTHDVAVSHNIFTLDGLTDPHSARSQLFVEAAVSVSNELSTVLWSDFAKSIPGGMLLTSDAGPRALQNAVEAAEARDIDLANLAVFQLPHHGSELNFDEACQMSIRAPIAIVSAPATSDAHPSATLVRQIRKAGTRVFSTRGTDLRLQNYELGVKPLDFSLEFEGHGLFLYRIDLRG